MTRVLIVFSSGLFAELSARPGRGKLQQVDLAAPRKALASYLERLSRDVERTPGTSHMRADLMEEPHSILRLYRPNSLAGFLTNFHALERVPRGSRFAHTQPEGYIAAFVFRRLGLGVTAAYLELERGPVLVLLKTLPENEMTAEIAALKGDARVFDGRYSLADKLARAAP